MSTSLIDSAMEPCVMLDKTTVSDSGGGFDRTWVEGAEFKAYVRKERDPELVVAQKETSNESFTVIVYRTVNLEYHDVFRRLSDNAVFRLTSNTRDGETHALSSIPIAKASCERWELV